MAHTLINFSIEETMQVKRNDTRTTTTKGYAMSVDPRKRFGYGETHSSIDAAIGAYEERAENHDFITPCIDFMHAYIDEPDLIGFIVRCITGMVLTLTQYLQPLNDATLQRKNVREGESHDHDVMKRYRELATDVHRDRCYMKSLTDEVASLQRKRNRIHRVSTWDNGYCYYIDVWQRDIQIGLDIARCRTSYRATEEHMQKCMREMQEIADETRYYAVSTVSRVAKSGKTTIIGYGVWDVKHDAVYHVKCAKDGISIPTNSFTPHIISDLMIEPRVTECMHHGHDHYYYRLHFTPLKETETDAI